MTISIDTSNCIATRTSPHNSHLRSKEGVDEGLASSLGRLGLLLVLLRLDALLLDYRQRGEYTARLQSGHERTELLAADGLGVRVEAEENALVDKGVLVLRPGALLVLGARRTDDGLDLIGVDETGDVRVADLRGREPG